MKVDGLYEIEIGSCDIYELRLLKNNFELDLFNKGYKIVTNGIITVDYNTDYELHLSAYKDNKLYCEISRLSPIFGEGCKVNYYNGDVKLKTNWYGEDGIEKPKSATYYNKDGKKFIYYGLVNCGSDERRLYKDISEGKYRKKEEISESDLDQYFSSELISL